MNQFKKENASLTHAQIVNEYEDRVRALEREIERLNAYRDRVENARYLVNSRVYSLRNSLKRKPNEIKQAQLELLRDIQEELK